MIISVYSRRKKAKIRFFAAYALSVLLILVLFSSFLKPTAGIVAKFEPLVKGKEDHHSAIYQMLHQRMEALDKVCVAVAADRSAANLSLLMEEEQAFYTSIDSIRKAVVPRSDSGKEKELVALLEAFSRAAEKQTNLARGIAPAAEAAGLSNLLQDRLQEKEQRLMELERQNRLLLTENEKLSDALQNHAATPATNSQPVVAENGGVWRSRYESMKAAHDRLNEANGRYATEVNDLKKSYRDVVEDNRRLLAQLQAARAGRN